MIAREDEFMYKKIPQAAGGGIFNLYMWYIYWYVLQFNHEVHY